MPFAHLERAAVEIGKRDPVPCLTIDGQWARLLRAVFGIAPATPLANPRLEALRRLVIALRRRRDPGNAIDAALTAGVAPDQVDHLLTDLHATNGGIPPSARTGGSYEHTNSLFRNRLFGLHWTL